jgi:glycosyltransferase involved in cell wall biosynthesis
LPVKISVIIPNYNHVRFLKQRILSVLNQTYQNFEVIILDDCSTDNSKEIIEQFRQSEKITHIVYNEKNSGSTFKQWKKGIELAQGEYIWLAESDDIAKPNFLSGLIEIIQKEQDIVIAYAASTSDPNEFTTIDNNLTYPVKVYTGIEFIKQYMLTRPVIVNASAVLFKRTAVDNYILTEITKYNYTGDWLFWNYLLAKGKIIRYDKILNFFRRHADSVAAKGDKSGLFVHEGFKLLLFNKKQLNIFLPVTLVKVWASVWAQTYLLNSAGPSSIIKKNWYSALLISPLMIPFFIFYYIKFRWFSTYNITVVSTI